MKTLEEADADYERVIAPLRHYIPGIGSEMEKEFIRNYQIEYPKLEAVQRFWQANPTGQLCQAAAMIAEGEEP